MIARFLPYALQLLERKSLMLTFVDVGSRNGVLELADLAPFVEAYGFEPNPGEYQKLVTGNTDAARIDGVRPPPYRKLAYFPFALSDSSGVKDFFVTPAAGASGLLAPNVDRLREIVWKGASPNRSNFGDEYYAGFRQIDVETKTLDAFAAEHLISSVDYLKIDVEGSEYEVLKGASVLLPKTGVIKTEVAFIPFRKSQKLFSHVDLLLREFGFDLLRYEIHLGHVGYKERTTPLRYVPLDFPDPHAQALSCDAIYVNRAIENAQRALAQALVLLEKDYVDEALHVLRVKSGVDEPEFLNLLRTYQGSSRGYWWRSVGYEWVDRAVDAGGRLARWLRVARFLKK
jgi:FkbM family methyltransferase